MASRFVVQVSGGPVGSGSVGGTGGRRVGGLYEGRSGERVVVGVGVVTGIGGRGVGGVLSGYLVPEAEIELFYMKAYKRKEHKYISNLESYPSIQTQNLVYMMKWCLVFLIENDCRRLFTKKVSHKQTH